MAATNRPAALAPLTASNVALLTTFRRNGDAVSTPVSIALNGDRVYFVTASDSGKAKRLAHSALVTLAPCTKSGKVLGDTVSGRARLLESQERKRAAMLLPTKPLFGSFLMYRLKGKTMLLFEVVSEN